MSGVTWTQVKSDTTIRHTNKHATSKTSRREHTLEVNISYRSSRRACALAVPVHSLSQE